MKLILDDGTEHELVVIRDPNCMYFAKERTTFPVNQTEYRPEAHREMKGWMYKAFVIDGKFYAVK